ALVHHPGGQAAGRRHPALEPRRRRSERIGPGRLVEQDAQARRRAEAHDRAVAQRCTGRLLVRDQDQAQGRTTDPGLAVDSSSVSPPIAEWEDNMPVRGSIGAVVLATVIVTTIAAARAHDETKYPDRSGQWLRTGGIQWDPTKPIGRGQQAPLTLEYQAIFEASLADQALGGAGNDPRYACLPVGMPRLMSVIFPMEFIFFPMEFIFTPKTTYILFENNMPRRIYTDGRGWPDHPEPAFAGYSIGKWIDADADGRYDMLEGETRHIKGPRTYERTPLPLHPHNQP